MNYKILADLIVTLHFLWIIFMIAGFLFTVYFVLFNKKFVSASVPPASGSADKKFIISIMRIIHLAGIIYVGALTLLKKHCPLTLIEYNLKQRVHSISPVDYHGSFIAEWIEKLVYPDVHPLIIEIPTIIIAVSTLILFIVFPPILPFQRFTDRQSHSKNAKH
ncbi:MAG: DUF2784 family protein [Elusimicrobiota bacterium]